MQWLLSIVLSSSIISIIQCSSAKDDMERIKEECKSELGLEGITRDSEASKEQLECFVACLLKKKGVMIDAKVDTVNGLRMVEEEISTKEQENFAVCADKANKESDECKVAWSFSQCLEAEAL